LSEEYYGPVDPNEGEPYDEEEAEEEGLEENDL